MLKRTRNSISVKQDKARIECLKTHFQLKVEVLKTTAFGPAVRIIDFFR